MTQLDDSLNSIMRLQMSIPESLATEWDKWKPSPSLLKACKQAS